MSEDSSQAGSSQESWDPVRWRPRLGVCWVDTLTLGQVHLVDEARKHMAILDVEVVIRAKNIGGNDGGEGTAVLLEVRPAAGQQLLFSLVLSLLCHH